MIDVGHNMKDVRMWKSFVWHGDDCFFVSTINLGLVDGHETLVWRYDWETSQINDLVHTAAGLDDHQRICRALIATGKLPVDNE